MWNTGAAYQLLTWNLLKMTMKEQNDTNDTNLYLDQEKRQILAYATVRITSAITGAIGHALFGDSDNVEAIQEKQGNRIGSGKNV